MVFISAIEMMLYKLPLVNGLSRAKVYHKQEITKEHLVFYIEQVVMTILRLLAVLQKECQLFFFLR